MAKEIVAGTDRRKRSVIREWVRNKKMLAGNVFISGTRIYKVNVDHTSSNVTSDSSSGKVSRLDRRFVANGTRDIGPYYASAGYTQVSSGRDSGARYSSYNSNEIVIGYAPLAQSANNGGWSDGGRVTVRFGFTLRLQKINKVD